MSEKFERYRASLSEEDLISLQALCFHKSEEIAAPYSALLNAPNFENRPFVQERVKRAYEGSADAILKAHEVGASGAEIFAYALASQVEGPGSIPGLISVYGLSNDIYHVFECNIMQERGGPLNSTFSGPYACGLTWNSYHFFDDATGEGRTASLSVDHLTEFGVQFVCWLYAPAIERLYHLEHGT